MLADWLTLRAEAEGLRCAPGYCSAAGMPPLWPWRGRLDGVPPELAWRFDGPDPAVEDREQAAARVVEVIVTAVRARPLIVLEDLHWADSASVLVARAVADAAPGLPVMLLLTGRDDPAEADIEVRDPLADLRPTCAACHWRRSTHLAWPSWRQICLTSQRSQSTIAARTTLP
jgi:hypothetical protein